MKKCFYKLLQTFTNTPKNEAYYSDKYPYGITYMPSIEEIKNNEDNHLPGKLEMFELME